jgi:hypothetical protein
MLMRVVAPFFGRREPREKPAGGRTRRFHGRNWTSCGATAIFAGLAIIFVARFVPETRGRPLESIDRSWTGRRRPAPEDG